MLWVELLLHTLQVRSRIGISKRRWALTPRRGLRENSCSRNLSVIRVDPIVGRYYTRWAVCFVVVRYYDRICYGLRDEIILIIFDGKNDSEQASAIAYINGKAIYTH